MLGGYHDKIEAFYKGILERERMETSENEELMDMLLTHYEKSVVLSFHDISTVVALLRALPK